MEEGIDEANNKGCLRNAKRAIPFWRKEEQIVCFVGKKTSNPKVESDEKKVKVGNFWSKRVGSCEIVSINYRLRTISADRTSFHCFISFLPVIFRIVKTIKDGESIKILVLFLSRILISSIYFRPIKLNAMKQHWKTEIFFPPSSSPPFYYVSREIGSRKESNINPGEMR